MTAFGIDFFYQMNAFGINSSFGFVKLWYFIKFDDVVECVADTCLIVVDVFICLTSNCKLLMR